MIESLRFAVRGFVEIGVVTTAILWLIIQVLLSATRPRSRRRRR